METRDFTMIYEEPSNPFDEQAWLRFRDEMLAEVELHPDWPEAAFSLHSAEDQLAWIKNWQKKQQQKTIAEAA